LDTGVLDDFAPLGSLGALEICEGVCDAPVGLDAQIALAKRTEWRSTRLHGITTLPGLIPACIWLFKRFTVAFTMSSTLCTTVVSW
jgi:hypothetical protein